MSDPGSEHVDSLKAVEEVEAFLDQTAEQLKHHQEFGLDLNGLLYRQLKIFCEQQLRERKRAVNTEDEQ